MGLAETDLIFFFQMSTKCEPYINRTLTVDYIARLLIEDLVRVIYTIVLQYTVYKMYIIQFTLCTLFHTLSNALFKCNA